MVFSSAKAAVIQPEVSVLIEQSSFLMFSVCCVDVISQWLLGIAVLYTLTEVTS